MFNITERAPIYTAYNTQLGGRLKEGELYRRSTIQQVSGHDKVTHGGGASHNPCLAARKSHLNGLLRAGFCTAQVIQNKYSSFPLQFVPCLCPLLLFALTQSMYVYGNIAITSHLFPTKTPTRIIFPAPFLTSNTYWLAKYNTLDFGGIKSIRVINHDLFYQHLCPQ